MGKHEKLRAKVISGTANANISFADLCAMLLHFKFKMTQRGGSHCIFTRAAVQEIINLQPAPDGKAKAYQVRQVCDLLQKYDIK